MPKARLPNPKSVPEWPGEEILLFHDILIDCKGQLLDPQTRAAIKVPYVGLRHISGSCGGKWNMGPNEWDEHKTVPTIVVLTQPQWGAYYHFLIDSLPRVVFVSEKYPKLMDDPNVYFHTGYVGKIATEWAQMFGIKPSKKHNRLLAGYWKAKTAVYPPSLYSTLNRPAYEWPDAAVKMRNNMHSSGIIPSLKHSGADFNAKPSILLLHRSSSRILSNFDELFQSVSMWLPGWDVKNFSDARLPDVPTTCALFHDATIIMGVHGAGFANMICSRPKAFIVEFQERETRPLDFEFLADRFGLNYRGVPTEIKHQDTPPWCTGRPVNLTLVEIVLREVESRLLAEGPNT